MTVENVGFYRDYSVKYISLNLLSSKWFLGSFYHWQTLCYLILVCDNNIEVEENV